MAPKVTDHFKTSKGKQVTPAGKTRGAAAAAAAAQQEKEATEPEFSPDEVLLRSFDLTYKYGPTAGITRKERWDRAEKFGLQPPQEVADVLARLPPDSKMQQGLWYGRV